MGMTKREHAEQRRARASVLRERRENAKASRADAEYESERKRLLAEDPRTVRGNYDNEAAMFKRRRSRRSGLLYALIGIAVCAVGIVMVALLFFKIGTLRAEGVSLYGEADILAATGLKLNDNLFSVNANSIARELPQKFPYIESVNVECKWPDTVILHVTETYAASAVSVEGAEGVYTLLSPAQKVLETGVTALPLSACVVFGATAKEPKPGFPVVYGETTDSALLTELEGVLAKYEYASVTQIDLTDPVALAVVIEDRLTIELGSAAQLDYKLMFAKDLIDNEIDDKQRGVITVNASNNKATFRKEQEIAAVQEVQEPQIDEGDFPAEAERPYTGS